MSMYGAWPKLADGTEQKAWPVTACKQVGEKGYDGRTVQADRDDADINKIISRFQKTGQVPPMRRGEPFYGDVSDFGDLADSLIKIQEAKELFMQYPAEIRERFDNDERKLIAFLADENNRPEAVELGLIQAPAPDRAPPAAEPAAP